MQNKWWSVPVWTLIVGVVMVICLLAVSPWTHRVYQQSLSSVPIPEKTVSWQQSVIWGPIWEEVVFRGVPLLIFLGLTSWIPRNKTSKRYKVLVAVPLIVIFGSIFAALHYANGGRYMLLPTLTFISIQGMLFTFLAIKTKNIYAPVALHALWNGCALLL